MLAVLTAIGPLRCRSRHSISAMPVTRQQVRDSKDILTVSVAMSLFLFLTFALSTLLLLARIPVSCANAVIPFIIAVAFVAKQSDRKFTVTCATILLLSGAIALASFYYDDSWDGNAYHKLSAGLIESGWNPIFQTFGQYANETGWFLRRDWDDADAGFYDGYPKASYLIGASLYALTGFIESGKAFTIIGLLSAVGTIAVFAREMGKIRWWQSFLVALAVCVNPVTVTQLVTFMNDGFLALLIFQTAFALAYLAIDQKIRYPNYAYCVVFLSTTVALNLKFSALLSFGLLFLVFISFAMVSRFNGSHSRWVTGRSIKKHLAFLVVTTACATVVLGLTSYVHNSIFHRNPLYPMLGQTGATIVNVAIPPAYSALAPIQQFGYSLFSRVDNDPNLDSVAPKIPFTVTREEARSAVFGGSGRIAGWGIWFGGILIFSMIVYCVVARSIPKRFNFAFLALMIVTVMPAFFVPAFNNARFWPLPLLIPPVVLLMMFVTDNVQRTGTFVATALLAANLALPTAGLLLRTKQSWETKTELTTMAMWNGIVPHMPVSFGAPSPTLGRTIFNGLLFNLRDAGINRYEQFRPVDLNKLPGSLREVDFSVSDNSPVKIQYVVPSFRDR